MRLPTIPTMMLLAAMAPMLSGCGVDVAFASLFNAGSQAKAAKNAVQQQEEAKKKVLDAIEAANRKNSAAMKDVQAQADGASPDPVNPSMAVPAPADTSAAMRAAEEQTK